MEIKWDNECKRCGTGCTHDYCHDCQMLGHDPSLSNYRELKPSSSIWKCQLLKDVRQRSSKI